MIARSPASPYAILAEMPKGWIHGAYWVVIITQCIYIFTFNWHPELRLPMASLLATMHVVLAGVTILIRPTTWILALVAAAGLMILLLVPPHFMGLGEVRGLDVDELFRRLSLPLMMIWILSYPLALPIRLVWCAAVFGTLYAGYIAYTEPPFWYNVNDDEPRLASLTGGLDQVHPSGKFIALQMVLIDLLRRGGFMNPVLAWSLLGLCVALMSGYGTRAQLLFVAVYWLYLVYCYYREILVVRWAPLLGVILGVTVAVVALEVGTNVETWGSGRIGTWYYRLQMVAERDLVTLLFGGGIGADNVWTPTWGWDPHLTFIAHNDYLFFLMDHGIVGLAIPFLMLGGLWLCTRDYGRAIVVGVAVSSFVDNGYFRSPLLAAYLAIVLATSILVSIVRDEAKAAEAADDEAEAAATRPANATPESS